MFKAVASRPSLRFVVAPVSFAIVTAGFLPHLGAQQAQRISLQGSGETALEQTLTGGPAELRQQLQSQRSAIAVAVADFDRDGAKDLLTGYTGANGYGMTLQRGNLAAIAPTGAEWTAYTEGSIAAPFSAASELTALPVRPDMMQAVDLNGDGAIDVIVLARGDSSAYLLLGDGKGGFGAASAIAMGGTVTAMTTMRAQDASSYIVASVCNVGGCRLRLVDSDSSEKISFALPAPATSILVAPFNGSGNEDIAVVSGGSVLLFDGAAVRQGQTSIETLPIQNAAAISEGHFVWDRRGFPQMAVVDTNGSLHVLARTGLDPYRDHLCL